MSSQNKKEHLMAQGTLHLIFAHLLFFGSGYLIHFGLGRLFGPSDYGRFGIILALLSLIEIFVNTGLPQTISKFIAEKGDSVGVIINAGLKLQIVFSFILFSIYFLSAPLIAQLLGDQNLVNYIRLSAVDIPLFAVFVFFTKGVLSGLRNFRQQTRLLAIYSSIKVVAVFILVLLGYGLYGAITGYILASGLGLLFSKPQYKTGLIQKRYGYYKIIKFSVPIIVLSIALTALMSLDLFFVQAIMGDITQTGYYTAASIIAKLPYYIFLALAVTLLPSISYSISRKDTGQTRNYIKHSMRYMLMLTMPLAFLISGTSDNLLTLVYSAEYISGGSSLSILIFGLTILSFFLILSTVITASGKPLVAMMFSLMLIPINVFLNMVLIPVYDLEGAAGATTITAFIGLIIVSIYVYSKYHVLVAPRSFINIMVASVFIYGGTLFFSFSGPLLVIWYLLMFFAYGLILIGLREITDEDIILIKRSLLR
ncbi:MAG: flippase [Candidatus Altiarchaeota archaeon]